MVGEKVWMVEARDDDGGGRLEWLLCSRGEWLVCSRGEWREEFGSVDVYETREGGFVEEKRAVVLTLLWAGVLLGVLCEALWEVVLCEALWEVVLWLWVSRLLWWTGGGESGGDLASLSFLFLEGVIIEEALDCLRPVVSRLETNKGAIGVWLFDLSPSQF